MKEDIARYHKGGRAKLDNHMVVTTWEPRGFPAMAHDITREEGGEISLSVAQVTEVLSIIRRKCQEGDFSITDIVDAFVMPRSEGVKIASIAVQIYMEGDPDDNMIMGEYFEYVQSL